MEEIDFLPEAYRKKCQKRRWVMRRIYISVAAACVMTVLIGWDQHSIRQRRLQVQPLLQHHLMSLENTRLQHDNVLQKLRDANFQREQVYLTLLRVSRSRILGEAWNQAPPGTAIKSIGLNSQPEVWIASAITGPNSEQQAQYELEKLAVLSAGSHLRLILSGASASMKDINLYETNLLSTGLFSSVKLKETRQSGTQYEFSFLATVVNPYDLMAAEEPAHPGHTHQDSTPSPPRQATVASLPTPEPIMHPASHRSRGSLTPVSSQPGRFDGNKHP